MTLITAMSVVYIEQNCVNWIPLFEHFTEFKIKLNLMHSLTVNLNNRIALLNAKKCYKQCSKSGSFLIYSTQTLSTTHCTCFNIVLQKLNQFHVPSFPTQSWHLLFTKPYKELLKKDIRVAHSHRSKRWYLQTRSHPHHTLHLHLQLQLKEMRPNINKQLELIFRDLYNGI